MNALQFNPVSLQLLEPALRVEVSFVGEVVGRPGEAIDDADRLAQRARQQQRRNREVLVMADRHLRAIIRCFWTSFSVAKVAELVDAPDLGSGAARLESSS